MYWYGDIHMADISLGCNFEQPVQPVVVVSDDISNKKSLEVYAIPIIGDIEQVKLKDYMVIGDYGLHGKNIIAIERMVLIDQKQVFEKVGSIRGTVYMEQIMQAVKGYFVL